MTTYNNLPVTVVYDSVGKTITLSVALPVPDMPSWARWDNWYPQAPQTVSANPVPIAKFSTNSATAIYVDSTGKYFLTTYNSTTNAWSYPGTPCDSSGNPI